LGVIGAAAGVAKLRRLSAAQTADAIRLAANMPLGLRAIHGSTGKPYLCGMAAKLGIEAVDAVAAGIEVQPDTFGRRRGFADTLNGGVLKRDAINALGKRFSLVDPGIAYKLHPLCSATQAAIDATAILMEEHGFTAADVESVQCDGTDLVAACLPYNAPVLPSQAQFSMTFAIGCTLLHGDVNMQHLNDSVIADPALVQLMQRINLQADANLVPAADAVACPEAARVEIRLRDGRIAIKTVLAAIGMPQNPAGDARLQQKFIDCTAPLLGEDAARALWETIHQVDQCQDVHGLLGQSILQET
jgi:2-methylcitrate dehydratase PrpD